MKVQSAVQPKKTKILGNRVLVRSNITQKTITEEMSGEKTIYEYDEEVYSKDEYIEKLDNDNKELSDVVADLTEQVLSGGV